MSAIIDFFVSLVDIFVALINMVITTVKSVLWLVTNLPQLIDGVTSAFAYAPTFLMPFLLASMALLVVFAIIRLL